MRFGVIIFPGTSSDMDFHHVLLNIFRQEVEYVWHKETDLSCYDCVIIPGGCSYGDYLRAGAIARFSPVMGEVERFAAAGGLVLGSCNGFQILCEAGLLPGVLLRNVHLEYRCQWVHLQVTNTISPFVAGCSTRQVLCMPISHYEGCYFADEVTLAELEDKGQIVLRYSTPSGEITAAANPNGSLSDIAGITNSNPQSDQQYPSPSLTHGDRHRPVPLVAG